MKMLTKEAQGYIDKQMFNKARDIDVALYNAISTEDEMFKDMVLDALMLYKANDGGFGNGLHIDNYNGESSAFQIYEAFRLLDMAGVDASSKSEIYELVVNKAMNVLYNRMTPVKNKWQPNIKSTENFAHAKIYELNDENTKLFGYHPTAAILGYTLSLCNPTKAYYKKALKMVDVMLKDFYQMESLTKYEFISFNSFLASIKKLGLYKEEQEKFEAHLTELALKAVSLDFENEDAILPLDCANALSNKELNDKIDEQLDYIISSIASHGLWDHKGTWGSNYPEEDSAKLKWIGAESVNNYYILKKYGRIE